MIIPSHLIIAQHTYDYINRQFHFKLNYHSFRFGNIKPDLMSFQYGVKHYQKHAMELVVDLIISLINDGLFLDRLSIHSFSIRLGAVCHFLSDFCCLPHYNRDYFDDKLAEHLIYESNLHQSFLSFSNPKNVVLPTVETISREAVTAFIEELVDEYSQQPPSHETDIRYSIHISSCIAHFIIEHSISYVPKFITA